MTVLSTFGGNGNAAYRIARFLRQSYETATVFVPGFCKSAGTLVCIRADELVIADSGEMGTLDVHIREPNELFESRSGLAIPQALDFLETRMRDALRGVLVDVAGRSRLGTERASEIAVNTVVGVLKPIYAQIDPAGLGDIARALAVAGDYVARLDRNLKPQSLELLVSGYSSHGFVIDREEAKELFKKVRPPRQEETVIANKLGFDSQSLESCAGSPTRVFYSDLYSGGRTDGSIRHNSARSGRAADPPDPGGANEPDEETGSENVSDSADASET